MMQFQLIAIVASRKEVYTGRWKHEEMPSLCPCFEKIVCVFFLPFFHSTSISRLRRAYTYYSETSECFTTDLYCLQASVSFHWVALKSVASNGFWQAVWCSPACLHFVIHEECVLSRRGSFPIDTPAHLFRGMTAVLTSLFFRPLSIYPCSVTSYLSRPTSRWALHARN